LGGRRGNIQFPRAQDVPLNNYREQPGG